MNRRTVVAAVLAIAIAIGGVLVFSRTRESAPPAGDASTIAAASTTGAAAASAAARGPHGPHAVHDPKKREELRQKLLAAYAEAVAEARANEERSDAGLPPLPPARGNRPTNDLAELGRFIAQAIREDFIPLASACAKDLGGDFGARYPDGGTTTINFVLLGDTEIGGVVNEVDTDEKKSTLRDPAFERCIRESLYGVYFDPPPAGGQASLNFDVVVDANRQVDDKVDDFKLKDRRNER